jgi:Zn-dependent M16 (insulinase) family peptidase
MTHPAFELTGSKTVPSLNLTLQEYRHRSTGARHLHLAARDTNNAFLVAFPTVPQDSTGVAHILEHTTLCGSRRFPVRDPFFLMARRSLNTFMNAFTAADWTAYPFATKNPKDFNNLLQVYLDAVFFPRLDPLDFAQEGHRVEFEQADEPGSNLVYKGVVYNEMKGAMSSPLSQVWQTLQSHLFPTTTYHYNSGGDPEQIPNLTYEELKAFHAGHYHPSNAVFMTYGSHQVEEHQVAMEAWVLGQFRRQGFDLNIPDERRYSEPQRVEGHYTFDAQQNPAHKTHVVLGWLLGKTADLPELMRAHLLTGVLLDNSSSPLRHALETTDLGTSPSELCGLEDSMREAVLVCGLEGSDPERAGAVERLVLDVLEEVADKGVPKEQVESVLHQVELSQREIGGGRFPYGLQLMMRVLPAALHGGDPAAVLDLDPALEDLRKDIEDPAFIKRLTRQVLLDNPHRIRLAMAPDTELSGRRARAEAERLVAIKTVLSPGERASLVDRAAALKARQERSDDPEILPKVGLADVPDEIEIPEGRKQPMGHVPLTWFSRGTNGLVYVQAVIDLPELPPDLLDDVPLLGEFVTEVGSGDRDYRETQAWQAAVSGGISARTSLRSDIADVQRARGVFVLAAKGLSRNQDALSDLLWQTLWRARFDEYRRLRELVAQLRAQEEGRLTDHGHVLAMTAACAGMGPCGALAHRWDGLEVIRRLKSLDKALAGKGAVADLAERLARIRDAIVSGPLQLVAVADEHTQSELCRTLATRWGGAPAVASGWSPMKPQATDSVVRQGWRTATAVSFCAKAYPTVPQEHEDAPALTVLGPFLKNGFLHRAIREQGGAYGAGAGYSPDTGAFRFYSYRDPRLRGTLEDFDRSLDWLQSSRHEPRRLEEAILNVISEIDRPDSPAAEAIGAFFGSLHGRSPEQRRRFRHKVLKVSLDDLQRVGQQYLRLERASVAVVSGQETLERHEDFGLELRSL